MTKKEKEALERSIIEENLIKIKKGDVVKIVSRPELKKYCLEEEYYKNKTFKVVGELKKICGAWCAPIEKIGLFDVFFLEKVE